MTTYIIDYFLIINKNEIRSKNLLKVVKLKNLVEKCCNVCKILPYKVCHFLNYCIYRRKLLLLLESYHILGGLKRSSAILNSSVRSTYNYIGKKSFKTEKNVVH